ncbi:MAG: ImmA/IrrE family metallo-endopeptidase [Lachnospiraceae bacterium]|nr:ImmA/IrrE family metallo-endopeptidase [Lachnospiraceae bacterium]
MRLSDETYEYIKQAVADMFVDYDIKGLPISSFEVAIKIGLTVIPYSALSKKKRLKVMEYSDDGFSVETNTSEWIIYYNDESKDYSRINQTIMHEVGHYILGHVEEGEEEESEAKFFAKYALASPVLIHNVIDEKTVENIMENFDIGFQAANYAMNYYDKWLQYGPDEYEDYEIRILEQLEIDVA